MKVPRQNVTVGWRCFHCDDYFDSAHRKEAAEHFGGTLDAAPACKIAQQDGGLVGYIRQQERELESFREEDTPLHRRIASLICEHAGELRREEEKGYARGLADGRGCRE